MYVLWVLVAFIATLFLAGLLSARLGKNARYQQARNGIIYVLLATAAVYAAFRVAIG